MSLDENTLANSGATMDDEVPVQELIRNDEEEENQEELEIKEDDELEIKEDDDPGYTYMEVWELDDEKINSDVKAFWGEHLPKQVSDKIFQHRLSMLCAVAYDGDKMIGVSTIDIQANRAIWCKIAFFRCMVAKDYRRSGVAGKLALCCNEIMINHSIAHPSERIQALGMQVKGAMLGDRGKRPFWPELAMCLSGYDEQGLQIRLSWFDHARVDY